MTAISSTQIPLDPLRQEMQELSFEPFWWTIDDLMKGPALCKSMSNECLDYNEMVIKYQPNHIQLKMQASDFCKPILDRIQEKLGQAIEAIGFRLWIFEWESGLN